MFSLAVLFHCGAYGVAKNHGKAKRLYRRVIDKNKNPAAIRNLKLLEESQNPPLGGPRENNREEEQSSETCCCTIR